MSSPGFENISCFIFDIDGVLTDGMLLVLENGLQARQMNVKDGYALQLAVKKGYRILVVSGAGASPVIDRLSKLGISDVHMGIKDKRALVNTYIDNHQLDPGEVLFMGDDMPDLGVMSIVGLPACPADAVAEIRGLAKYISPYSGGRGCVRDVIEHVMKNRGHWQADEAISSQ